MRIASNAIQLFIVGGSSLAGPRARLNVMECNHSLTSWDPREGQLPPIPLNAQEARTGPGESFKRTADAFEVRGVPPTVTNLID